jgi:acetylornithine/succinyldiaminopimelate/putrescine aminotransferase
VELRKISEDRGSLPLKRRAVRDESQCELGRDRWFAYERYGLKPDVIGGMKPLAGGLPLSAIIASEAAAQAFAPGMHGTTFGGGPLQCRLALKVLEILERPGVLEHVREMGVYFRAALEKLKAEFPVIRTVRGEGLMLGVELDIPGKVITRELLEAGFLVNCTQEKVLRFLPPFIVERHEIDELIAAMKPLLASQMAGEKKEVTP